MIRAVTLLHLAPQLNNNTTIRQRVSSSSSNSSEGSVTSEYEHSVKKRVGSKGVEGGSIINANVVFNVHRDQLNDDEDDTYMRRVTLLGTDKCFIHVC